MICYGVDQGPVRSANSGKEGSEMGLFSVRGRLPEPAERPSPVRVRSEVVRRLGAFRARLAHAAIAATNDARIVAILLVLAAVALGLEMAASFHVI